MDDGGTLTEYGRPIDPDSIVTPVDATELELEPGHPGLGDAAYIERRRGLFALCRQHRLEHRGPPRIDYTPDETRIWRDVSPKLHELHLRHAAAVYLRGKRELAITEQHIPQLRDVSARLAQASGMRLVPAEGALPYRYFLRLHRAAQLSGDAIHPPRLPSGVHARAGHDP